jgi:hypothetical protein
VSGKQDDAQRRLVDKIWLTLFGGGDNALLAAWCSRREGKDRSRVRAAEWKAVTAMLAELDDLHAGRRIFNRNGEIVEAGDMGAVGRIRLNPLIEVREEDPLADLRIPDVAEALQKVRLDADIQALRRSLNVRRVGLKAEVMADKAIGLPVSDRPVDPDWLYRWNEAAARAVGDDFQDLWARVLLDEVRQPGTHGLRTLAFLATLARADIETLRIAARLELSGALCREATGYFQADIHEPMFDQLVDIGLLEAAQSAVTLATAAASGLRVVLRCQNKALYIEGVGEDLDLAVQRFTRLGREVLALFGGNADSAYLFSIGNSLKKRGFKVDIGDWVGERGADKGLFTERLRL